MTFTPSRRVGLTIGIVAIVILLGADALFVVLILQTPLSVVTTLWFGLIVLSVPTIAFVAYRTVGLLRAYYTLDQNAFVIHWGGLQEVVPMSEISRLVAGRDVETNLYPRGLWWPGCLVGQRQFEEFGPLAYFATAPQDQQVYVVTESGAYVVSPESIDTFFNTFDAQRIKGITEPVEYETIASATQQWDIWRDRWAQGIVVLPLLAIFFLFGLIAFYNPLLPAEIPLHFNSDGIPDRLGPPSGLFILPFIATFAWLINTPFGIVLHVRGSDRTISYLLWFATIFVQALLWAAALYLINSVR